jgi:hypothetical protein
MEHHTFLTLDRGQVPIEHLRNPLVLAVLSLSWATAASSSEAEYVLSSASS